MISGSFASFSLRFLAVLLACPPASRLSRINSSAIASCRTVTCVRRCFGQENGCHDALIRSASVATFSTFWHCGHLLGALLELAWPVASRHAMLVSLWYPSAAPPCSVVRQFPLVGCHETMYRSS